MSVKKDEKKSFPMGCWYSSNRSAYIIGGAIKGDKGTKGERERMCDDSEAR